MHVLIGLGYLCYSPYWKIPRSLSAQVCKSLKQLNYIVFAEDLRMIGKNQIEEPMLDCNM